ncbi:hypothetical protein BOPE631_04720 [Bordetella pertussis]|uniref:formate dehydrogenase n=1 Tax=Bordetella pertussis TaxID=520 RepID=UPI0039EEBC0C
MSQRQPNLSRRAFFAGAATVGAAAVGATVLPGARPEASGESPAAAKPPAAGGGYRLSEHVKRYYKTTLV